MTEMSDHEQSEFEESPVIGLRVRRNRETGEVVSGLSPIYVEDFPFSALHVDQPLLRYMDLWKFEDLLKSGELYFCRADKFNDPLEGTISKKGVHGTSASDLAFYGEPLGDEAYENASAYREIAKACTFVNCWHMNHEQCAQMWEAYTESPESVLVITTAGRLLQSLKQEVLVSPVKYVSKDTPKTEFTERSLFFYKDDSYAFEKEFRLLVDLHSIGGSVDQDDPEDFYRRVPIDVSVMIDKVAPHPDAPPELLQQVEALAKEFLPSLISR